MSMFILRKTYFPIYSYFVQCYIAVFLVCIAAQSWSDTWIKFYLNLARVGYWFYAIITCLSYVSSSFYFNIILPFFRGTDRYGSLISSYRKGFMAGFTSHYSNNGMYLAVGFIIAAVFCISSGWKKYRLETIFMAFSLLLTGKRAHILFGVAALFLAYCILKLPEKGRGILKILGIVTSGVIVVIIMFLTVPAMQNFASRLTTNVEDDGAMMNRFAFWGLAWKIFKSNPIFGIGWGEFRIHAAIELDYEAYTHNVFLQLLCECGIVGTLAFLSFFIITFIITIKTFYQFAKMDLLVNDKVKYLMFSFTMQTFFFAYCLTGNPLYDRIMYIPYFISCGIAYYYYWHSDFEIFGWSFEDLIKLIRKNNGS